jgi:hypothetical protein
MIFHYRIKKMLHREEVMHPNFYDSMRRSLIPLMHDDLSPILRAYTDSVVAKSRSKKRIVPSLEIPEPQSNGSCQTDDNGIIVHPAKSVSPDTTSKLHSNDPISSSVNGGAVDLANFTDEDLILELAKRKRNRLLQPKVSNNSDPNGNDVMDPTGQICTLNGGNGTIPCRELME